MTCDYGPLLSLQMYGELLGWRGCVQNKKKLRGLAVAHRLYKALYDTAVFPGTEAQAKAAAGRLSPGCLRYLSDTYDRVFPGEAKRAQAVLTTFLMDQENAGCPKVLKQLLKMQSVDPGRATKKTLMALACFGEKFSKMHYRNILLGFTKPKRSAFPTRAAFRVNFVQNFIPDTEDCAADAEKVRLQNYLRDVTRDMDYYNRFMACFMNSKEETQSRRELLVALSKCTGARSCSKDLCGLLKMRVLKGRSAALGTTDALIACCLNKC